MPPGDPAVDGQLSKRVGATSPESGSPRNEGNYTGGTRFSSTQRSPHTMVLPLKEIRHFFLKFVNSLPFITVSLTSRKS